MAQGAKEAEVVFKNEQREPIDIGWQTSCRKMVLRAGLEPAHPMGTAPSRRRVYQFHHLSIRWEKPDNKTDLPNRNKLFFKKRLYPCFQSVNLIAAIFVKNFREAPFFRWQWRRQHLNSILHALY